MSIPKLPQQPMPDWLASASDPLGRLPLTELLSRSVYYPACEFDGGPVKFLAGNFHSFVYVDCRTSRAEHLGLLEIDGDDPRYLSPRDPEDPPVHLGFRGYRLLAWRDVRQRELKPDDWIRRRPQPDDGLPPKRREPPFAIWSILERTDAYDETHGPTRFSLLYIGGDGVASFDAMYLGNQVSPAVIAIIQPGSPPTMNWTDFEDPNLILARLVRENPAGPPQYLLYGGWGPGECYSKPCWPEYSENIQRLTGRLGLWQRRPRQMTSLFGDGSSQ